MQKTTSQKKFSNSKFFACLFCCIVFAFTFNDSPIAAQSGNTAELMSLRISQPTPNAASLGKFIDFPVGFYTGVPQINIPLIQAGSRKLSLPISLSYNASGIKVEERASWVGLGWTLNAGGVITRSVRGIPDDYPGGYLATGDSLYDPNSQSWTSDHAVVYQQGIEAGTHDGMPDVFYFNFPGGSGQFVLDPTTANDIRPTPFSKISIQWNNLGTIDWFKIMTTDGTVYLFEEQEVTDIHSSAAGDITAIPQFYIGVTTAWYLTEIQSPVGDDTITLEYQSYPASTTFETTVHAEMFYEATSCKSDFYTTSKSVNQTPVRLHKVTAGETRLEFNTNAAIRLDALSPNGTQQEYRLENIEVFVNDSLYKRIVFDNNAYFSSGNQARLKLNGVYEESPGGSALPGHKFSYNTSETLPGHDSNNIDHWGYYNGANNGTGNFDMIPAAGGHPGKMAFREPVFAKARAAILEEITYPTGGKTSFEYELNDYGRINDIDVTTGAPVSQTSGTAVAQNGSTASVDFTVGGVKDATVILHVSFSPEPTQQDLFYQVELKDSNGTVLTPTTGDATIRSGGDYGYMLAFGQTYTIEALTDAGSTNQLATALATWADTPSSKTCSASGLRIKKITIDEGDGNASNDISREFIYTLSSDEERSSGVITRVPRYLFSPPANECSYTSIANSSQFTLGTTQGGIVGYEEVRVLEIDAAGDTLETRHVFRTAADGPKDAQASPWPGAPYTSQDWQRGQLLRMELKNTQGQIVREIINEYETIESPALGTDEDKVVKRYRAKGILPVTIVDAQLGLYPLGYSFEIISGWQVKKKETLVAHDPVTQNSVSQVTEYFYDDFDHAQLTSTVETNTGGEQRITEYEYAHEIEPGMAADTVHMYSQVYATTIKKSAADDEAKQWIIWNDSDGEWRPREAWSWKDDDSATNAPAAPRASIDVKTSELIEFDEYGNLKSGKDANGTTITTLWNLDKTLPIATIAGADPDELFYDDFEEYDPATNPFSATWTYNEWSGGQASVASLVNDEAYTGTSSYKLVKSTSSGTISIYTKDYIPVTAANYEVQVVVKGDNIDANAAGTTVNFYNSAFVKIGQSFQVDKGGTFDWTIHLHAFTPPAGTIYVRVWLRLNNSSNGATIWFDQFRLFESGALVTSQSYDPTNLHVINITDENAVTASFDYDEFGRLTEARAFDGTLVSANEYYFSRDGNGDAYNAGDPNSVANTTYGYQPAHYLPFSYSDSPTNHGWKNYTSVSGVLTTQFDAELQSQALHTQSNATWWDFGIHHPETGYLSLPATGLEFRIKTAESFYFYVYFRATNGSDYYITYRTNSGSHFKNGSYIYINLGSSYKDGTWKFLQRDLQEDIESASGTSGITLDYVRRIYIRGSYDLDDLKLIDIPTRTVAYLDGLGRNIQSQARLGDDDIIARTAYNKHGRVEKEYKPRQLSNSSHAYYSSTAGFDKYVLYEYADDPLLRPKKQFHFGLQDAVEYNYGVDSFNGALYRYEDVKNENQITTRKFFDKFGNEAATKSGIGLSDEMEWDLEYDILGNVAGVNPPNFYDPPTGTVAGDWDSDMKFNTLGQLVQRTTPDEGTIKYVYDGNGNLVYSQNALQDPADDFTVYHYDAQNRVTLIGEEKVFNWGASEPDPGDASSYGASANEWRVKHFYDLNYVTGSENFSTGRLTKTEVNADNNDSSEHIIRYVYDAFGNMIEKHIKIDNGTAVSEKVIRYVYDLLGREIEVIYPGGNSILKQYDQLGRLIKIIAVE